MKLQNKLYDAGLIVIASTMVIVLLYHLCSSHKCQKKPRFKVQHNQVDSSQTKEESEKKGSL